MDRFLYGAFVSFSGSDHAFARRLHQALEGFSFPSHLKAEAAAAQLRRVYRDSEELASSSDLSASIKESLEASRALIVICSPRAAASKWVQTEIEHFIALGRRDRVFAILSDQVEGEPSNSLPFALIQNSIQLTADARKRAGGFRSAVLVLISALLGIDKREISRSRAPRRAATPDRPMFHAAGIAIAAAAVFALGLAAFLGVTSSYLFSSITEQIARAFVANWIALLAATVSVGSAIIAANQRRQEMRIGWNRELMQWAKEAMSALSDAQEECRRLPTIPAERAEEIRVALQKRLSAAVDHGRLFFENIEELRPQILDPLVAVHRMLDTELAQYPKGTLYSILDVHRRNFWKRVQRAIDPRWVRRTIQGPDSKAGQGARDYDNPMPDP